MSDYISKSDVIKIIEKAIENSSDFLQHDTQIDIMFEVQELPTLDEKEIIRNAFERVVARLEELRTRYFLTLANTGNRENDVAYENVANVLNGVIAIVKEEGGIE